MTMKKGYMKVPGIVLASAFAVLVLLVGVRGSAWAAGHSVARPSSPSDTGSSGPPDVPENGDLPLSDVLALSLEGATALALENDELLMRAAEGVKGAIAGMREAKSGRLPSLTVSGYYGRNIRKPVMFLPSDMADAFGGVTKIEIGEDNDISVNTAMTWNIWTAGRLSAGIGATSSILEAMKYSEAATRDYVRFAVKQAYYDVLLSMKSLDIARKALAATEEVLRITKAGFEQGTVSRFHMLRAEVEYENRVPQLIEAGNMVSQAEIMLRRRCGLEQDTPLDLTDRFAAGERPDDMGYHISLMRSGSPEIMALQQQVEAMRHSLDLEKAERWPVLQFGANFLVQSQWSEGYLPETKHLARSSALTLGFQVPIFDGFKAKSRIDGARAELRSAEIELERVENEKEMNVRASWLMLDDAFSVLTGRQKAVDLAEEAHRLALVRLRNGLATHVEMLDAELAMTTANAQLAQALYACNIARAQLELVTGIYGYSEKEISGEGE
ncbi:MAG: TolC family protein [Candidatus Krumholzibacteria bacterium]|nr:TolC family protein [Candidatus Krumholzibacteria bacterium]